MERGEMYLWWVGQAESMFVYYLTGSLALAFFITLAVTRSLRRTEPAVTELMHDDTDGEMLVTYMIAITTSLSPGCGCPEEAKVFMQLNGETKQSQFFQVRANTGGKAYFCRGFTDIFLFKVPCSLGEITSAKLVISGLEKPLLWRIRKVQLFDPSSRSRFELPVTVMATEVIETQFTNDVTKTMACDTWFRSLFIHHQWLAMFGNTVRFGAFTEVVHVLAVFTSLLSLLTLSQIVYITLPRGTTADEFELNLTSLLIGTCLVSWTCSVLSFCFEVLVRNVLSHEKKPGNAYYTVIQANRTANARPSVYDLDDVIGERINSTSNINNDMFVMNVRDLDRKLDVTQFCSKPSRLNFTKKEMHIHMPYYMRRLLGLLEMKQTELQKRDVCGPIFTFEEEKLKEVAIDMPKYSELCLNRLISSHHVVDILSHKLNDNQKVETYFDVLKRKRDYTDDISVDLKDVCSSNEEIVIDIDETVPMVSNKTIFKKCTSEVFHGEKTSYNEDGNSIISDCSSSRVHLDMNGKNDETHEESKLVRNMTAASNGELCRHLQSKFFRHNSFIENHIAVVDLREDDTPFDEKLATTTGYTSEAKFQGQNQDKYFKRKSYLKRETVVVDLRDDYDDESNIMPETAAGQEELDNIEDEGFSDSDEKDLNNSKMALMLPEVKFSLSSFRQSSHSILQNKVYMEWQAVQKTWCREFVQSIYAAIKFVRESLLEGKLMYKMVKEEMLDLSRKIINRISITCCLRVKDFHSDLCDTDSLLCLISHLATEIVVLTRSDISHILLHKDTVSLPDLVIQSHHVMLAVEQATDCVLYSVYQSNHGYPCSPLFGYLNIEDDLNTMSVNFIQSCFQLAVKYNDLTWAYFKILLKQKNGEEMDDGSFYQIRNFVEENLQHESEEDIIVTKLCKAAIHESKEEVFDEYHSEKDVFSDIVFKVQVLNNIQDMVENTLEKKQRFDKRHDLLPKVPKSRLQLLVEKRRKKPDLDVVDETKTKKSREKKGSVRQKDKVEVKVVKTREQLETFSKRFAAFVSNLQAVHDGLKKKWTKLGLKSKMDAKRYLVQSILHPLVRSDENVDCEKKQCDSYKFHNALHILRTEKFVARFLEEIVHDLTQFLIDSIVLDYRLKFTTKFDLQMVIQDVVIKTNMMAITLSEDLDLMVRDLIPDEDMSTSDINDTVMKGSANLLWKKSSCLLNLKMSAFPESEEFLTVSHERDPKTGTDPECEQKTSTDHGNGPKTGIESEKEQKTDADFEKEHVSGALYENEKMLGQGHDPEKESLSGITGTDPECEQKTSTDNGNGPKTGIESEKEQKTDADFEKEHVSGALYENEKMLGQGHDPEKESLSGITGTDPECEQKTSTDHGNGPKTGIESEKEQKTDADFEKEHVSGALYENEKMLGQGHDPEKESLSGITGTDPECEQKTSTDNGNGPKTGIESEKEQKTDADFEKEHVSGALYENEKMLGQGHDPEKESLSGITGTDPECEQKTSTDHGNGPKTGIESEKEQKTDADFEKEHVSCALYENEKMLGQGHDPEKESLSGITDSVVIQTTDGADDRKDKNEDVGSRNGTATDNLENITFQDIITDLRPVKHYLQYIKMVEDQRTKCTKIRYLEGQKKKREYICTVNINNILDSYHMIEEGDDSHMFTKAGLYQLEHDITGESGKPLPRCVKTLVLWIMMLIVLFSLVYVTLVSGQFSTTELQEWMCFYLLSVLQFGIIFETLKACLLSCCVKIFWTEYAA